MRHILSLILTMIMLAHSGQASFAAENIRSQITAEPVGAAIELRLKNKQHLRGARGEVSDSGFMLVDSRGESRQIAFADIASIKHFKKSHAKRNIFIGAGIGFGLVV